jgi:hypothetical protein
MTWGGRRSRWGSEKEEAPRAISFTGIVKTILEVVPGGVLRAGKTAYADDANVGFWLGVDTDGVAKLNIGGALHYLKWTGTALVVAGDIRAGTVTGSVGVVGGEITWAGGKGRMDANGIAIRAASTAAGDRAYALEETNGADMAWYTAYSSFTFGGSEPGLASHLVLRSRGIDGVTAGAHARTQIEAHSTTGHAHVLLSPTNNAGELDIDIYVDGAGAPHSDFDGLVLGNIGDAAAAGDALNRRTADVRYAPLAGAHAAVTLGADADGLLELAGQQITLAAQGANQVFVGPVSGADAEPMFRALAAADLPGASESAPGAVVLATQAEQEAGTSTGLVNRPAYNALRKVGAGWALGTGGRDRGAGACDLQQGRSADDFVASGPYALIAGGRDNAATCEAGHAEGVFTLAGGWLASYVYTCADRVMAGFSPALVAGGCCLAIAFGWNSMVFGWTRLLRASTSARILWFWRVISWVRIGSRWCGSGVPPADRLVPTLKVWRVMPRATPAMRRAMSRVPRGSTVTLRVVILTRRVGPAMRRVSRPMLMATSVTPRATPVVRRATTLTPRGICLG